MQKSWLRSLKGSMEKRPKKLGNRNQKKKRRNSLENYQGSLQPNQYMDGEEKGIRRRGRKDRKKIGIDGKVPQNKEP